jgi:hypothetical protein
MGSEGHHPGHQPGLRIAGYVDSSITGCLNTYSCSVTCPAALDSNYNGDWSDLIRFRYGLDSYNATKSIDFWTDPTMIESYKLILNKFLRRTNTINGRVYGSDDTLGMIESGNEMK